MSFPGHARSVAAWSRRTTCERAATGLAAAWLAGCLPFAVPPARVSAGAGGELRVDGSREQAEGVTGAPVGEVKVSVNPLGLFAETHRRTLDVGLGYGLQMHDSATAIQGPFLMFETFLWTSESSGKSFYRLGTFSTGGLAFASVDDEWRHGVSGSIGLDLERTGWLRGAGATKDIGGAVMGEWSLGTYVSASYSGLDGMRAYSLLLGLEGRLPGIIGAICCNF